MPPFHKERGEGGTLSSLVSLLTEDVLIVATLQPMDNKPTVTLERDPDNSSTYVVKKKHHCAELYNKEKANLDIKCQAMEKNAVTYPAAKFDDATSTIAFGFIGHRVRMHSDRQVEEVSRQLTAQLNAAHSSGTCWTTVVNFLFRSTFLMVGMQRSS